jgi:hypothetical protein
MSSKVLVRLLKWIGAAYPVLTIPLSGWSFESMKLLVFLKIFGSGMSPLVLLMFVLCNSSVPRRSWNPLMMMETIPASSELHSHHHHRVSHCHPLLHQAFHLPYRLPPPPPPAPTCLRALATSSNQHTTRMQTTYALSCLLLSCSLKPLSSYPYHRYPSSSSCWLRWPLLSLWSNHARRSSLSTL